MIKLLRAESLHLLFFLLFVSMDDEEDIVELMTTLDEGVLLLYKDGSSVIVEVGEVAVEFTVLLDVNCGEVRMIVEGVSTLI